MELRSGGLFDANNIIGVANVSGSGSHSDQDITTTYGSLPLTTASNLELGEFDTTTMYVECPSAGTYTFIVSFACGEATVNNSDPSDIEFRLAAGTDATSAGSDISCLDRSKCRRGSKIYTQRLHSDYRALRREFANFSSLLSASSF